jgi:nuclear pore complex protein Nup98-Nup96
MSVEPFARQISHQDYVKQASLFRIPKKDRELARLDEERTRKRTPFRPLNRKHSRESDGAEGGPPSQVAVPREFDGGQFLKRNIMQRASFGHDLGVTPVAPSSRKYARIPTSQSVTTGQDSVLGRSFRVGWGPSGAIVHPGRICGPFSDT